MLETLKTAAAEFVSGKPVETVTPVQPKWHETEKMMCMIWNGKENMEYVSHPKPCITEPKDILLKVTATTICGSDLHLYRGTFPAMKQGDIQGHEFMGFVVETGPEVKKLQIGDRVVVGFAIACGECDYCRREEFTACEKTNPSQVVGKLYHDCPAAFYGYSHLTGGVPGGHAEYVRVPFADVNCFPIPSEIPDEKALYLTDVIPTALFGAKMGEVREGDTVGIWGLGPIGLMCAQWCQILGAKRVIGIDIVPERLELARKHLGIDVIDFGKNKGKVVEALRELNGGPLDVGIECAGFDYIQSWIHRIEVALGLETDTSEILDQIFKAVRKFGRVSILGVYSGYANHFPIGILMEKGLTVRGGQCPAQKFMNFCIEKMLDGEIDPSFLVTDHGTLADGPRFFEKMNNKEGGCIKVFMKPEHKPVP